jgi:hypothetical protein
VHPVPATADLLATAMAAPYVVPLYLFAFRSCTNGVVGQISHPLHGLVVRDDGDVVSDAILLDH